MRIEKENRIKKDEKLIVHCERSARSCSAERSALAGSGNRRTHSTVRSRTAVYIYSHSYDLSLWHASMFSSLFCYCYSHFLIIPFIRANLWIEQTLSSTPLGPGFFLNDYS